MQILLFMNNNNNCNKIYNSNAYQTTTGVVLEETGDSQICFHHWYDGRVWSVVKRDKNRPTNQRCAFLFILLLVIIIIIIIVAIVFVLSLPGLIRAVPQK